MYRKAASAMVLLAGCTFVSGCASMFPIQNEMSSWKGLKIDELLAQVGPPTYVRAIGIAKTYEWEEDNGGTYTYGGAVQLHCTRIFGVDENDIIVSWNWTGPGCSASPTGRWMRKPLPY